jgi:hypothetical protein
VAEKDERVFHVKNFILSLIFRVRCVVEFLTVPPPGTIFFCVSPGPATIASAPSLSGGGGYPDGLETSTDSPTLTSRMNIHGRESVCKSRLQNWIITYHFDTHKVYK